MEGFLIFAIVIAVIVMFFRFLRKREIAAFRQADMAALQSFNSDREKSGKEPVEIPDEALVARAALLTKVPDKALEVELRKGLFDEIHQRFYFELERAVEKQLGIFLHVPVNAIVRCDSDLQNRLLHKTVSFVICHPVSLKVIAVIQLKNGGSGADGELDLKTRILSEVGIPLITYPMISGISATEILDQLGPVMEKQKIDCPQCGGGMRLRKVSRGKKSGQTLKMCTRYPECKGRIQVSMSSTRVN